MGFLTAPNSSYQPLPLLTDEAARDLMADEFITRLFQQAEGEEYTFDWMRFLTDDPEVLRYRRAVLEELEENPSVVEKLRSLSDVLTQLRSAADYLSPEDVSGTVRSFSMLRLAYDTLTEVRDALDEKIKAGHVSSEGLTALHRLSSEKLAATFPKDFPAVWDDEAPGLPQMGSMLFRFTLNEELRITGTSLCSVQKGRFQNRQAPLLPADKKAYLTAPWDLSAPKDMTTPLAELIRFQTNNAARQFTDTLERITSDLEELHSDLLFYLSALIFSRRMAKVGVEVCFPEIRPAEEKAFTATALANPVYADLKSKAPVTNDVDFQKGGEILVLTGINQGGKTTFLRSVGMTQLLFQLGWPVPAETAYISPVKSIATVFSHEEDTHLQHGKLGQELSTIRRGLDGLTGDSLLLCNEPVTGTSPMENLYLSREVLIACKLLSLRGIWVTHLYDLAQEADEMNAKLAGSTVSSIIAVVNHDGDDVSASYHIRRGAPEFTSYAKEMLAKKKN